MAFPLTPSSIIFGLQGGVGLLNGFSNLLFPALVTKNSKILNIASIPALQAIALGAITFRFVFLFDFPWILEYCS